MEWAVGNDILGRVSRHGELKTEEAFFSGPSKHVACLNMTTPTYNICLWRLHRRTQLWAAYLFLAPTVLPGPTCSRSRRTCSLWS